VTGALTTLTAALFARDAGGRVVGGDGRRPWTRLSIDTRTLQAGAVYLAIKGPRFDGHAFLADALGRGAAGLVVSDASALPPGAAAVPVVVVGDTVQALQDVARAVRRRSAARVVAITGSAGKTTTKEAAAAIAETRFRTLRNRGNLNNHIGLPLSLLELQDGAEVAVVELGMNHAGEIRRLVEIAEPDVRVWTNVGTAHIEYFGSQAAIADAKAEILEGSRAGSVCVANADDALVMPRVGRFPGRLLTFGVDERADVRPLAVDDRGLEGLSARIATPAGELRADSPLAGRANLANVLAAVAVGVALDVPAAAMAGAIATLRPAPHRGVVLRLSHGVVVYDDCYNASPSALLTALAAIGGDRASRRRVAFLGEMLELGEASRSLHETSGEAVARAGIAALVTVGGEPARALGLAASRVGVPPSSIHHVETSEAAASLAASIVRGGDLVLVKGSRGTRMERVVDRLQVEFA
jgi:UDP-N-acetylmuramoyl-tripeptide--D-alanyl-D-alanine ligase